MIVGPDGLGKTPLTAELCRLLEKPSFKFPFEKDIFKGSLSGGKSLLFDLGLAHFLKQTGFSCIFDRGYPCEYVYSKVYGRETDLDMIYAIDQMHASLETTIILLVSTGPALKEDDLVESKMIPRLTDEYMLFQRTSKARWLVFDVGTYINEDGTVNVPLLARDIQGKL